MLHGNFYSYAILLSLTVNDFRIESFFTSVQIAYEFADTAFIVEYLFPLLSFSLILKHNAKSLGKESHLTKPLFQDIVIVNGVFKDFLIRKKIYLCSGSIRITIPCNFQRIHGLATLISLFIFFSITMDRNLKPLRKCIYYRCTYTVKSAGYLISSTAELATCVKNSKYNLNCRNTCLMIDTYRNSTTIICNCNGVIRIDIYMDLRTKTSQCFIDCIVHDLIYEMMKSTAGGTSDIHSRPLTYGFQSLQNLDLIRAVFCILCAHVIPPVLICPGVFENSFLQNLSLQNHFAESNSQTRSGTVIYTCKINIFLHTNTK